MNKKILLVAIGLLFVFTAFVKHKTKVFLPIDLNCLASNVSIFIFNSGNSIN